MMTYKVTATTTHNGTRVSTESAEVLGEAFQRSYETHGEAERTAERLQATAAEYGYGDVEYGVAES